MPSRPPGWDGLAVRRIVGPKRRTRSGSSHTRTNNACTVQTITAYPASTALPSSIACPTMHAATARYIGLRTYR
jgi:hypothetical protein